MFYRYRMVFLVGFILLLAGIVTIGERYRSRTRIDFILNKIQQTHKAMALIYGLNPDFSTAGTIQSASGPFEVVLPENSLIQRSLPYFYGLVCAIWQLAQTMQERYQKYDLTGVTPKLKTEFEEAYDFTANNGETLKIGFDKEKQIKNLSIQSDREKHAIAFSYFPNGQPRRILFGEWKNESMGFELQFQENGKPQLYLFLYQGSLLGPAILWSADGTVQQAEFFQHPQIPDTKYNHLKAIDRREMVQ